MKWSIRLVLVALAALLAPACAPRIGLRSADQLAQHREKFIAEVTERRMALSRCAVDRIILEQDAVQGAANASSPAIEPTYDVLILSGGGDYGAFGAGVLKGWGAVSDSDYLRPQFDVVTGVSTGALIAPFAFVGTDSAYDEAFYAYREPKPDWFRVRNLLSIILLRESFMDNSGLRREIAGRIDEPMLRTIADGGREHRLLLIGTTNLDLGLLTMWDATRLAGEITAGRKLRSAFDDVILASTAIPAVFPPVHIDGDHYVDGGVTRNIAYTTDQDSSHSTVSIWKREHAGRKFPKTRIWVIINNQLTTRSEGLAPSWPSVMERSLDISVRSATLNSLKSLAVSIELLRLRDKVDIELRFIAIPDDWKPPVPGEFKKETMASLAELGSSLGANPASWLTTVPNPEFPEN